MCNGNNSFQLVKGYGKTGTVIVSMISTVVYTIQLNPDLNKHTLI